mmetsp:Transcript_22439/g.42784  ORF Transcript_22439/g.42784 Transcript_22439/m.42784 type:complete len:227 (+) Transcript_22439:2146-2826(+)
MCLSQHIEVDLEVVANNAQQRLLRVVAALFAGSDKTRGSADAAGGVEGQVEHDLIHHSLGKLLGHPLQVCEFHPAEQHGVHHHVASGKRTCFVSANRSNSAHDLSFLWALHKHILGLHRLGTQHQRQGDGDGQAFGDPQDQQQQRANQQIKHHVDVVGGVVQIVWQLVRPTQNQVLTESHEKKCYRRNHRAVADRGGHVLEARLQPGFLFFLVVVLVHALGHLAHN